MGIISTFICLLAALPGPPGLTWDGAWFQAVPVRRDYEPCDVIDPYKDVSFYLYKDSDSRSFNLLIPNDEALLQMSGFNSQLPTVLYIHGFLNGPDAEEVSVMKQAYAARGGHNFIVVGWKRLSAGPWYLSAVANVVPVGRYIARLLDFLEDKAGPLTSLHVIGHSLGAHVAGVAASNTTSARVERITGLDPALPLASSRSSAEKLDPTDAPFVDIIHTDGDNFGVSASIGHADFFPNSGGRGSQPGCSFRETLTSPSILSRIFCSHRRSYWLFAATVVRELVFPATSCDSWPNFEAGKCADQQNLPMGYATPKSARGSYYLNVNEVPPY